MNKEHLSDLDLLRLRFWLSQIVLLLALGGLIYEGVSRSPLLLILTVFVSCTVFYPPLSGIVPRRLAGKLSLLLLVLVIMDFALFWRYSVDPIIRMGLLIIVMRTIFYRTGRETSQVLVMALGMIMLTGVTSVSVSYALQLVLFVPLAMILLILLTVWDPDSRDLMTHEDWKGFSVSAFAGRLMRALNWRFPTMIMCGTLVLLLMSTSMFFVFPRFNFGMGLSMKRQTPEGSAMVGFSEDFSLGGISEILDDDTVAFRVHPESTSSMPRIPYWRMLVLDRYERGSFARSDRSAGPLHPLLQAGSRFYLPHRSFSPDFPRENGYDWTFYLEGSVSRFLPYPGAFGGLRFQKTEDFEFDSVFGTFNLLKIPSTMTVYQLGGLHPETMFVPSVLDRYLISRATQMFHPSALKEIGSLQYPHTTRTLVLNDPDREYLMSQVMSIRREMDEVGSNDFLQFAVAYLQRNHEYSLKPPVHRSTSSDDDPVIDWMRRGSSGHCEYFAAAFTLLSRAAGYPCRIVKGFLGGEWSEYREYFVVRNRNAHAWCEVFNAESGWTRYDPTPSSGSGWSDLETARGLSGFATRWSGWVDTVRMRYYRYVIDFDEQDQMDVAMIVRYRFSSWGSVFEKSSAAIARWMAGGTGGSSGKLQKGIVWKGVGISIIVFGVGIIVFKLSRRIIRRPHSVRRNSFVSRGYEARMRWKSRKVLRGILTYRVDSMGPVFSQLQCIRFGRVSDWPDRPGRVIRDAARGLRRSIRDRRRIKR